MGIDGRPCSLWLPSFIPPTTHIAIFAANISFCHKHIMLMKSTFVAFSVSLVAIMNSCDQGVQPEPVCSAVALDSTSHAFTWTITELGDGGGSILRDVGIINDTLIYAVGELYLRDSTGEIDPLAYNAAVWNGSSWTPKRITVIFRGNLITPPLYGIFGFSPTDIWLSAGVPIHGDGENWTQYHLFDMGILTQSDGSIMKLWGSNSSNVLFVGNKGTIVRHSNGSWQKLSSGTTLPINDIWGARNPATGQWQILAVASDQSTDQGKRLLRIDNQTVTSVGDNGLSWSLNGVWFVPDCMYYVVGDGLYPSQTLGPTWARDFSLPAFYKTSIRGNGTNDVAVAGALGLLMHYNGSTWRNYQDSLDFSGGGSFAKVDFQGNTLVAVGTRNNRAIAVIGRR